MTVRITVVDLTAVVDMSDTTEIATLPGLPELSSVLYVPLPRTVPGAVIDNALASAPGWALRNQLTILAVHRERLSDLNEDLLADISRRVEDAPVYVLSQDQNGSPELRHRQGPVLDGLDFIAVISAVRQADVSALLNRPGAHLPATKLLHYEGPNGQHYDAFVRPGFALRNVDDLDRLAFWLLPHLRGRGNVVVDHWSMMALGYHAAGYAARFDERREAPVIQTVESYDEDGDQLASRLGLSFPAATVDGAVFLLSVNSSGHLAANVVLPALKMAEQKDATVVALASSPPGAATQVPSLCSLGQEFARHPNDECEACRDGRRCVVPIEHDTYLMRLAAFSTKDAIKAIDSEKSRTVVEAYKDLGVFTVHKHHDDGRHHAFHIDVLPMLGTPRFAEQLAAATGTLENLNPDLIIHPPLNGAAALARMVADRLGTERVLALDERQLLTLNVDERDLFLQARQVLVVDDVVITGRRLEGYRQQILRLRREHGTGDPVDLQCLVAVARAPKPAALRGTTDVVHHGPGHPSFAAVESLFLPNWDQSDCPWCLEMGMLGRLPESERELPLIAARIAALRDGKGLRTGLFFPWPDGVRSDSARARDENAWAAAAAGEQTSQYADRYWELNPGSVFGELQDADLMVSVAAAVHSLRLGDKDVESRLDDRIRPPVSKTLDPDLYLLGRFYEPVLIAAILRACRPWDIRTTEGDNELAGQIVTHLSYLTASGGLSAELLVHAALGRLPAVPEFGELGSVGSVERATAESLLRLAR